MRHACAGVLALCVGAAAAGRNVSLDDTFSQWKYNPPVCEKACDGAQEGVPQGWWQLARLRDPALLGEFFGSTQTATNLVGASATLLFSGTHVYYYGSLSPFGGVMNITLDDKVSTITTKLEDGAPTTRQALLWHAEDLDPTLQHQLIVTMAGGNIIDVDRVDITLVDQPEPNPTLPQGGDDDDDDDEGGRGGARTWLILAILGGCIGSLLFLCLVTFLCVRRKRRAASRRVSHIPGPVMRLHSEEQPRPLDLAPSLISPLPPVPPQSSDPLRLEFPLTPPPPMQQQQQPIPQALLQALPRPVSDPIPQPVPHYAMVRTASMKQKTVLVSTWEPDPLATPRASPTESDIQFTPHRASSNF